MVDGCGQVVVPADEVPEVQDQQRCRQRVGRGAGLAQVAAISASLERAKWVTVTSHPIVGEPLTELIDHDEEDAQGVTKATLVERKTQEGGICSSAVHTPKPVPVAGKAARRMEQLNGKQPQAVSQVKIFIPLWYSFMQGSSEIRC